MNAYYQPPPDRNYRRAVGETPYTRPSGVRLDTTLPNRLVLLQQGIRSDTEALAPEYNSGEIVSLANGQLATRRVRVNTPTDSYWEQRTYMGFGAGDQVVDVTDVLSGESPLSQYAQLNVVGSESGSSGSQGLETSQLTQTEQTAQTAESTDVDVPEVIAVDSPEAIQEQVIVEAIEFILEGGGFPGLFP